MGGGAWPFLVGGAICLVNSVNERDLSLLTSYVEVCDALRCSGPHARYTDVFNEYIALADRPGKSLKFHRDGDRSLQLLVLNEEFLICRASIVGWQRAVTACFGQLRAPGTASQRAPHSARLEKDKESECVRVIRGRSSRGNSGDEARKRSTVVQIVSSDWGIEGEDISNLLSGLVLKAKDQKTCRLLSDQSLSERSRAQCPIDPSSLILFINLSVMQRMIRSSHGWIGVAQELCRHADGTLKKKQLEIGVGPLVVAPLVLDLHRIVALSALIMDSGESLKRKMIAPDSESISEPLGCSQETMTRRPWFLAIWQQCGGSKGDDRASILRGRVSGCRSPRDRVAAIRLREPGFDMVLEALAYAIQFER
ncbi:hypothetical protein Tco_0280984 [Tanacetum coccineum]